jgi:hypothetical protein
VLRSSGGAGVPILCLGGDGDGVCGDCKVGSGAKSLEKPLKLVGQGSDTILVGEMEMAFVSCFVHKYGSLDDRSVVLYPYESDNTKLPA